MCDLVSLLLQMLRMVVCHANSAAHSAADSAAAEIRLQLITRDNMWLVRRSNVVSITDGPIYLPTIGNGMKWKQQPLGKLM